MKHNKKINLEPIHDVIGFTQVSDDCLRLNFGKAAISLYANGNIILNNEQANISLMGEDITIQNNRANVTINKMGEILLDAEQLKQKSKKHIKLDAKQHIYLNSQ